MTNEQKLYVHVPIDQVDTVVYDPEARYDGERYDRYATFVEARDAALCCVEAMLDEQDYDGEDHRQELERMLGLLEGSETFESLEARPDYHWFLDRLAAVGTAAA